MLLILGLLDVSESWGSCWGRWMARNIWEIMIQPSKMPPYKEVWGRGGAAGSCSSEARKRGAPPRMVPSWACDH